MLLLFDENGKDDRTGYMETHVEDTRWAWRTVQAVLVTLDGGRHLLAQSVFCGSPNEAVTYAQIHWEKTHKPDEDLRGIHPPTIFDEDKPVLVWRKGRSK